jgi:hypothetical protein
MFAIWTWCCTEKITMIMVPIDNWYDALIGAICSKKFSCVWVLKVGSNSPASFFFFFNFGFFI